MDRLQVSSCVKPPSPSLICPICQDVFLDPVITNQCFHSFCKNCISKALEFDGQCPLCRKKLKMDDIHSNLALNSLVAELVVFCPFKAEGCTESMRFEEVSNHVSNNCLFAPKKCIYNNYGCQFSGVDITLKQHLATCHYHALRAFIKTCDQRISHLETIVMEQQQVISHFLSGKKPSPTASRPIFTQKIDKSSLDMEHECESSPCSQELRVAEHNWLENGMNNTKTITAEKSGITSLMYADSGKLYAGSYDGSIKVFDYYSGSVTKLLQSHRLSVWALALDSVNDKLYSGCSDEIINVWSTSSSSSSPVGSFSGNRGKIYSMQLKGDRLYSASSDNVIRIWNCNTMELIGSLVGHKGGVNSIKFHENYLISASSDKTIKIWDLQDLKCITTIDNQPSEVLDVTTGSGLVFASGYDATITAFNLNDFNPAGSMAGHRWEVWELLLNNNALFSGSHDHTLKIWDIRNFQNSSTLVGHKGYIHALTWGNGGLLSGGADRTIRFWN